MKSKIISLLLLATIIMLGACGDKDESPNDTNNGEQNVVNEDGSDHTNDETNNSDTNTNDAESDENESFVISDMEPTPFEEIDGKTAVQLNPADWSDPYDIEELRWKIYYGNNELITAAPDKGIFRYDLENDDVMWQFDGRVNEIMMSDGILYAVQLEDSHTSANIGTLDLDSGKQSHLYKEEDYTIATRLHFIDDLMLFVSTLKDKQDDHEKDLIVYDLASDNILWTKPVAGIHDQLVVDLGDNVLLVNEYEAGEDRYEADETAYVYDKKTGEDKFNIVAESIRKTPVVNDEGIYFADFDDNIIQLYDFDGTVKAELQPEIEFSYYQLIQPIATDQSFIYADNEGIVWYDTDLSSVQHRVELGESTIRYMEATDDRVFAIVSEKTDDGEEAFYNISLDIETAEVYEKVALHTNENSIRAKHVYNNKLHFAVIDAENQRELYYIFSSDVNKPID